MYYIVETQKLFSQASTDLEADVLHHALEYCISMICDPHFAVKTLPLTKSARFLKCAIQGRQQKFWRLICA